MKTLRTILALPLVGVAIVLMVIANFIGGVE